MMLSKKCQNAIGIRGVVLLFLVALMSTTTRHRHVLAVVEGLASPTPSSQHATKKNGSLITSTSRALFLHNSLAIFLTPLVLPRTLLPAQAAEQDEPTTTATVQSLFLKGTILLPDGYTVPAEAVATAAIYVTVRPDRPDNVPAAILSGTRGKPPPVLVARFPWKDHDASKEFSFTLTSNDVTVEGAAAAVNNDGDFWWKNDPLVISARLDTDGVAATRSPEDLVGRSVISSIAATTTKDSVQVSLTGRGAFGKFVTGASSSSK